MLEQLGLGNQINIGGNMISSNMNITINGQQIPTGMLQQNVYYQQDQDQDEDGGAYY